MSLAEELSFLLTNRIPRRSATLFMGWLSAIEQRWLSSTAIGLWKMFSDLDLSEAKKSHFTSVQDCFTRELKEGARPIDAGSRDTGQSLRRHRRRLRNRPWWNGGSGQGLSVHPARSAR